MLHLIKEFIKESIGAKQDEEFLLSKGWYPIDDRMMVWVSPDGEEVHRQKALQIIRPKVQHDNFPGIG